jgi:hypothetical protein
MKHYLSHDHITFLAYGHLTSFWYASIGGRYLSQCGATVRLRRWGAENSEGGTVLDQH